MKRSASLHPEIIDPFFEMYRSHLEGVPPERIYNCDETGIKTDGVRKGCCYAGKGAKSCYSKQPSEGKVQYTVMFTISAGGDLLPPYLLYKSSSDHLFDTWTVGRGICFAMLLGAYLYGQGYNLRDRIHTMGILSSKTIDLVVVIRLI